MKSLFIRLWNDESGATAIEYGPIAGLIGVVIIAGVQALGTNISSKFDKIANNPT